MTTHNFLTILTAINFTYSPKNEEMKISFNSEIYQIEIIRNLQFELNKLRFVTFQKFFCEILLGVRQPNDSFLETIKNYNLLSSLISSTKINSSILQFIEAYYNKIINQPSYQYKRIINQPSYQYKRIINLSSYQPQLRESVNSIYSYNNQPFFSTNTFVTNFVRNETPNVKKETYTRAYVYNPYSLSKNNKIFISNETPNVKKETYTRAYVYNHYSLSKNNKIFISLVEPTADLRHPQLSLSYDPSNKFNNKVNRLSDSLRSSNSSILLKKFDSRDTSVSSNGISTEQIFE